MDLLIQDSWLREYLDTDATPKQIQEYLSLCGPSVERVENIDGETVYHIEVTTNRVTDSASVIGIAREATAILPRFGIRAKLVPASTIPEWGKAGIPDKKTLDSRFRGNDKVNYLDVHIQFSNLCPRFTAVLLRNVQIKSSSEKIVKRLEANGLRAINNIIDMTNYLTIELGQPMHVFDYDEIKNKKMILRESKQGEEIQTLDEVKRKLPKGSIVIEDGEGRLIDLCGVMGGFLSHTKNTSRNILLFVQTYNPTHIRKTCQATSFRTDAAGLFEKWVDPEGIPNALAKALEILKEEASPEKIEDVIDIYPNPVKPKTVSCTLQKLYEYADEKIPNEEILRILNSLEIPSEIKNEKIICKIPSFRNQDIEIPEDIIEEIVRIYGYFNLKGKLPEGQLPNMVGNGLDHSLQIEKKIKDILVNLGLTEIYTLSMISEKDIEQINYPRENLVKVLNPLNSDENIMRPSLFPSLKKVIDENLKREEEISIFEMANVYTSNNQQLTINKQQEKNNNLPQEKMMLGIIFTKHDFREIKGKLEYLLRQLGITIVGDDFYVVPNKETDRHGSLSLQIKNYGRLDFIDRNIIYVELDVSSLIQNYSVKKSLNLIPKFPEAYEDLALSIPEEILYENIVEAIKKQSLLISGVGLLDEYGNYSTLRVRYQSNERNVKNEEIKVIREKILENLKTKFNIKLKS